MATELVQGLTGSYLLQEATLLNAVTAVGAGSAVKIPYQATDFSWHIKVTGAPTAVSVKIQGSKDGGTTWEDIDTSTITTEEIRHKNLDGGYTQIRGNLGTLTAGTAPTVTVKAIAKQQHYI